MTFSITQESNIPQHHIPNTLFIYLGGVVVLGGDKFMSKQFSFLFFLNLILIEFIT